MEHKPHAHPFNSNLVFLDDSIGEQLFAHRLQVGLGLFRIAAGQFQVDHLALAHVADGAKAQAVQGMADGLALGVDATSS